MLVNEENSNIFPHLFYKNTLVTKAWRAMNEINKFPIPLAINFTIFFTLSLSLNEKRERKKIAFRYAVCYPTSVWMQINALQLFNYLPF